MRIRAITCIVLVLLVGLAGCTKESKRDRASEAAIGTVAALVRNDSHEITCRFGRGLTDAERRQFADRLPTGLGGDPQMYASTPDTGTDWDSPVVWMRVTQANTHPPIAAELEVGLSWDDESAEWHAIDVVSKY